MVGAWHEAGDTRRTASARTAKGVDTIVLDGSTDGDVYNNTAPEGAGRLPARS